MKNKANFLAFSLAIATTILGCAKAQSSASSTDVSLRPNETAGPLSMVFVSIPHGTFQMGSPSTETGRSNDETLHTVTISHDFEMEATEVTQLQWFEVMGYNLSEFRDQEFCPNDFIVMSGPNLYEDYLCPNNPVENVSWYEAQTFIAKLNQGNDGYTYRLPTEAEWEYAIRAGTQTAYYFGNDPSQLDANAWVLCTTPYLSTSCQTHAVGGKFANAFGLYDMIGNVLEWVQDYYGDYNSSLTIDPTGPSSGQYRVSRGCATFGTDAQANAKACRSARRNYVDTGPISGGRFTSFRLVRTKL